MQSSPEAFTFTNFRFYLQHHWYNVKESQKHFPVSYQSVCPTQARSTERSKPKQANSVNEWVSDPIHQSNKETPSPLYSPPPNNWVLFQTFSPVAAATPFASSVDSISVYASAIWSPNGPLVALIPVDGSAFTAGAVLEMAAGAVSVFATAVFVGASETALEGFRSMSFASSTPEGWAMWCAGWGALAGWRGAGAEVPSGENLLVRASSRG